MALSAPVIRLFIVPDTVLSPSLPLSSRRQADDISNLDAHVLVLLFLQQSDFRLLDLIQTEHIAPSTDCSKTPHAHV